jgi:hypothetical protein
MVCNALLPALTCSSQCAAHVRSSHMDSSGAERRATIVMTAASEASDPVWFFASIAYCRVCIIGFYFVKVLTKSRVSCVFVVTPRVHAGEYRYRQANTPRQTESKKTCNVPGSCLHGYTGLVRVRTGQETDSLCHA